MIVSSEVKSKYPFTYNSHLQLSDGLVLSPGVFTGALLYPRCGGFNYCYISRLGRRYRTDSVASVDISTDTGGIVAVVTFDLTDTNATLVGVGVDNSGGFCGNITAAPELKTILNSEYYVRDPYSFVFTPSCVRPQGMYQQVGGLTLVGATGGRLTSLSFGRNCTVTTDGVGSPNIGTVSDELTTVPITEIQINNVKITNEQCHHMNICPDPGSGLRVQVVDGNIEIGAYRDL